MTTRKVFYLLLALMAIIFVPYIAAYLYLDGFPPDYFKFPPDYKPKPPANNVSIIIAIIIGVLLLLLYIYPQIYGFKRIIPQKPPLIKTHLPKWFWIGLIMFLIPFVLFTMQASEPRGLINWGLLPLFWGFTLVLDGIVFYINDGKSLISKSPTELIAMGVASISGWLIFEYLNFFIGNNWYYPKADLVGHTEFLLYAVLGSSGFIPMAFEWYYLLRTSNLLNNKYRNGIKIRSRKWVLYLLIIISLILMAIAPKDPNDLFYIIWVAPLVIIACALTLLDIWTPFTPIRNGNWTALLTFSLTFLAQGILLECWNYLSGAHENGEMVLTYNCAYWQYCIPYLDKWKIFEMPFFGYFGYLFFSVHCYLWWITCYKLMGIKATFSEVPDFK